MKVLPTAKCHLVSGAGYQAYVDQAYKHQQGLISGAIFAIPLGFGGGAVGYLENGVVSALLGGLGLGAFGFALGYLTSRIEDSNLQDGYYYQFSGPYAYPMM